MYQSITVWCGPLQCGPGVIGILRCPVCSVRSISCYSKVCVSLEPHFKARAPAAFPPERWESKHKHDSGHATRLEQEPKWTTWTLHVSTSMSHNLFLLFICVSFGPRVSGVLSMYSALTHTPSPLFQLKLFSEILKHTKSRVPKLSPPPENLWGLCIGSHLEGTVLKSAFEQDPQLNSTHFM